MNRSNASTPSANSRSASERLAPNPRLRSRFKFAGAVYSGSGAGGVYAGAFGVTGTDDATEGATEDGTVN